MNTNILRCCYLLSFFHSALKFILCNLTTKLPLARDMCNFGYRMRQRPCQKVRQHKREENMEVFKKKRSCFAILLLNVSRTFISWGTYTLSYLKPRMHMIDIILHVFFLAATLLLCLLHQFLD